MSTQSVSKTSSQRACRNASPNTYRRTQRASYTYITYIAYMYMYDGVNWFRAVAGTPRYARTSCRIPSRFFSAEP